ncbi:MAG: hypothetical protein KDD40_07510, partial [Bdellovibrionales bacterium]|nr:hypothetical protein [Bdellovibrionales bacterium]
MFKTQRISLSILSLAFTFVLNGQAEEKKLAKETTYNINSSNTSVSTIVRDNTAKLKLIEKYLFKEVAEALKKMP